MPLRLGCRELRKLPKPPTPLKSINFRRTTPGSAVILVTKYTRQPTSELVDPDYPGAHLPLIKRHTLSPRWTSPHLTLYAFPKAFLSKPDVCYSAPHALRPYPARVQRPERRSADMSMQVLALNSRVVLRPILRAKIKRRLREAVKLIVTRGAAVEESRKGLKVVFREEDIGANKWIAPDWTYVAMPTTNMFCLSLAEFVKTMRDGLAFIHRCIPEAEKALRYGGVLENGGSPMSPTGSNLRGPVKGRIF